MKEQSVVETRDCTQCEMEDHIKISSCWRGKEAVCWFDGISEIAQNISSPEVAHVINRIYNKFLAISSYTAFSVDPVFNNTKEQILPNLRLSA